jgi:chromosome segregation ATPase
MPFVEKLRGKAADLILEREDVSHERARLEAQLAQLKCVLAYFSISVAQRGSCRAKRAEDEPKLNDIRQENVSITSQLIAYKETQTRLLKDIESLKAEKSALVQKKVWSCSRSSSAYKHSINLGRRVCRCSTRDRRCCPCSRTGGAVTRTNSTDDILDG